MSNIDTNKAPAESRGDGGTLPSIHYESPAPEHPANGEWPAPGDPIPRIYMNQIGLWVIGDSLVDGKISGQCSYDFNGATYVHRLQYVRSDDVKLAGQGVRLFIFRHPTSSFFIAFGDRQLDGHPGEFAVLYSFSGEPNSFTFFQGPGKPFAVTRQMFESFGLMKKTHPKTFQTLPQAGAYQAFAQIKEDTPVGPHSTMIATLAIELDTEAVLHIAGDTRLELTGGIVEGNWLWSGIYDKDEDGAGRVYVNSMRRYNEWSKVGDKCSVSTTFVKRYQPGKYTIRWNIGAFGRKLKSQSGTLMVQAFEASIGGDMPDQQQAKIHHESAA